nr:DUF5615 family PIN-like protein [Phytoactinopolyspora mesophila]
MTPRSSSRPPLSISVRCRFWPPRKLLIDECLSARLCGLLAEIGHDAVHVGDLGLLGKPDADVMAAAKEDERVVISADTDFGELLAKSGAALPSVVLLRRPGKTPEEQAAVLKATQ